MPKRYDEDFRREAVKLVLEGGVPASRAAADLGVGDTTLAKWLAAAKGVSPQPVSESEREELKRLRKEVVQVKLERDILKKATAYFAKITS